MLDYTIVAGQRVLRNIRLTSTVMNVVTQLVSILFLGYILWKGSGIFALNLTLLALSVAYFAFFCFTLGVKRKKGLKRTVKGVFKWSKRAIKLFNFAVMLYALFTSKQPATLDIVIAVCALGCWVLDILLEIACTLVRSWGLLLFEGVKADYEAVATKVEKITAPFSATINFFKGNSAKEAPPSPPPPNKRRVLLDDLVAIRKAEKATDKTAAKQEKKAFTKAKRAARKALKQGLAAVAESAVSKDE